MLRRTVRLWWILALPMLLAVLVVAWNRVQAETNTPQAVPATISYTGFLADGDGVPLNGAYAMAFAIFATSDGGTPLWSESQPGVMVTDGYFSTALGSVTPLAANLFSVTPRYLEVRVDMGSGLISFPRQALTTVPYAFHAATSDHATTSDHAATSITSTVSASAPWAGLSGVPPGFADGVDDGLTSVTWNDIQNRPTGLDDGDNDTLYSAGSGIVLTDTTFSAQGSPYAGVVTVARSGADFTSIQAAIDSISEPSASNRYMVWIAPGAYAERVVMRPFVDVQGSGQQSTVITYPAFLNVLEGTYVAPLAATVVMANNVELRSLGVINSATTGYSFAILLADASRVLLRDVNGLVHGADGNTHVGLVTANVNDSVLIRNAHFVAQGAENNKGHFAYVNSAHRIEGSRFEAIGGDDAHGLDTITNAAPTIRDSVISARDGNTNFGINQNNGRAIVINSEVRAQGGTVSYGIRQENATGLLVTEVHNSQIRGTTGAVLVDANDEDETRIRIGSSYMAGSSFGGGGSLVCAGVYDINFIFHIGPNCP